jgi:hypothetical protein
MSQNWLEIHATLSDFIKTHSEITIEPGQVRIPDNQRLEFYQLFDRLRMVFIQDKTPDIIQKAEKLSQLYMQVENEVTGMLDLEKISMMPGLERFLHAPYDQLRRSMYDPLFDWLKKKIDAVMFESIATQNIRSSFTSMYQPGYEKWVSMALIKLLEADELLRVIPPDCSMYEAHKRGGIVKEKINSPEKSGSIAFEFISDTSYNTADWIIHSSKTGKYVSSRCQFGNPFGIITNASEKREWLPANSIPSLGTGLLLLCQDDDSRKISLFSDSNRVCRSEVVLVCYASEGWFEKEGMQKAMYYHQNLRPPLGTFVISIGKIPQINPEEKPEGITMLETGLNPDRLRPVIDVLLYRDR